MKRLGSVSPGTTVPATARKVFPGNAPDASAFTTMAGRVDSGPVARFTAAVAYCAADRAGEAGVKRAAAQVRQGNRPAAEKAVSAAVGTCINTAVPPMQRLPAKAAQRNLVDAVLWVELKMAS